LIVFNGVRECFAFAKLLKPTAPAKACQRVCLSLRTDERKESTIAQHCIRAIAGEVVKSKSVHLINFCSGGQVIASKSATALILERYRQA
jgi:hypothetical protein